MKTALVTGATGAIGKSLVRELVANGYNTRVFVRQTSPAFQQTHIRIYEGEITDEKKLSDAATGANVVFHLAARLHINNPSAELSEDYHRINVHGTRCVAEAAAKAGVERIIFFSTINVYGQTSGRVCDEQTEPNPDSLYAETKLRGEQIILSTMAGVVLRLAAVYGPEMKGNYPRLLKELARGRFIPVGDGLNRRTLVHEGDVVRASLLAAQHPVAGNRIYNVTDGNVHSISAIVTAICRALGRREPRFHIPAPLARTLIGIVEDGARLCGINSPVCRAMIDKLTEDVAVSGDRIQTDLSFQPQIDLDSGWQRTIVELRRRGQLPWPQSGA